MEYLNKNEIVDTSNIIDLNYKLFAHKKEIKKDLDCEKLERELVYEKLEEHISLANKYFFKICKQKDIESVFKRFEDFYLEGISEGAKKVFKKLLVNVVNFHDIGKINPRFQLDKMDNKLSEYEEFKSLGSKHSIISAVIYIDYFWNEVDSLDKKDKRKLKEFLFLNAYLIAKHHGDLDSYEYFVNSFKVIEGEAGDAHKAITVLRDNYKYIYKKDFEIDTEKAIKASSGAFKRLKKLTEEEAMYLYTYERLMFSLILAADFYSTTGFMSDIDIEDFGELNNINEFYKVYENTKVYKSIREYERNSFGIKNDFTNEKNINVLRTEMFLEAENIMRSNLEGEIFYLEAPTGAGKSNIATNLSFKLIKDNTLKKIFWIYPFNTLVEQNKINLEKIYENDSKILNNIATINSLTPIKIDESINNDSDNEFVDFEKYKLYAKALLNRQFLNYPMILTTHVGIFDTMFSRNKKSAFSFHQLANSVLVFDEIQSYKLQIWTEIISFLKVFSKILNIKIIIMSATLPNLDLLTNINSNTVTLIEDREKYFKNPLFKNRVKIDYSLIEEELDEVINHIGKSSESKKKILVEFIRKKTAYEVYEELIKKELKCEVLLLTGDDNAIDREAILGKIKSKQALENGVVLIATQVIEAGVDIDMDIGYKDISRLDGEEQFMGRINRSCLREGIVYFFNIDNEKNIYRGDLRVENENTLMNKWVKDLLLEKDFNKYYENIMEKLKENYNDSTNIKYSIEEFFKNSVSTLDFYEIEERMKLIDDDRRTVSVFLSRVINDKNGEEIDGTEIWNKYIELLNDKKSGYAKREVKLSNIRSKMSYFIYEVVECPNTFNDRLGDLYYIENGEEYFENNKINKEKIITGIGDFI